MYKIVISNKVEKELDNLPDSIFLRIDEIIQSLKDNAYPVGSIKLTDVDGYRIRVGSYRILYSINKEFQEIRIIKISHRKDAYKN